MSLQYNPYLYEHVGRKRHQEFIWEAEQYRIMRARKTPSVNVLQRVISSINTQMASGMRALARHPRRMQGAS